MDASTRERLESFLEKQGVRRTVQRQAIIEAAFGTQDHFSADELLVRAKQLEPTVSRATVYRTLPLLCASGLIKELDFGKGFKHYDPNYSTSPEHSHIICDDCDRIVEFTSEEIQKIESKISRKLGFQLNSQQVQLHGKCEELKQSGACEKKTKCKAGS